MGRQPAASNERRNFSTVSGIGSTSAATMIGRPCSTIHSVTSAVSPVREEYSAWTVPSRPTTAAAVVVPGSIPTMTRSRRLTNGSYSIPSRRSRSTSTRTSPAREFDTGMSSGRASTANVAFA